MATDGPGGNDGLEPRRETYDRFMTVTKWGIILVAVVLIALALFVA